MADCLITSIVFQCVNVSLSIRAFDVASGSNAWNPPFYLFAGHRLIQFALAARQIRAATRPWAPPHAIEGFVEATQVRHLRCKAFGRVKLITGVLSAFITRLLLVSQSSTSWISAFNSQFGDFSCKSWQATATTPKAPP
ncbi:hypothetical protein Z517_09242 [Fonsecaea pedrosoi CBS 271.37]|uniref:Uncharacterized protein n=1 Tax=Fonsecaea pedrosoi CBS 271.37 TaxID=1442368 RepID=A0A0D2G7Y4_9EURO|nr:uncharacterized protein Z517_09242 [Fonsecaea pedrosoi CBS 271.37]KIW76798.1 hypothetical protein Z517_09242 [Fonsecaea pedrosoi CBS 271.37]